MTTVKKKKKLNIAIEIEEDRILDQIANERLRQGGHFVSHEEAWK